MTALSNLFTDEVVQRLALTVRTNVSSWDDGGVPVRRRHEVVRCLGPSPWQSGWALRQAWELYLESAKDCGLLDDLELVANLTGTNDESFRGALAECNAAWFLRDVGLAVTPKPEPKNGKNIDFAVARGEFTFYVEVKAPYVELLTNCWSGDDSHVLRGRVEAAGKQFKDGPLQCPTPCPNPSYSHLFGPRPAPQGGSRRARDAELRITRPEYSSTTAGARVQAGREVGAPASAGGRFGEDRPDADQRGREPRIRVRLQR